MTSASPTTWMPLYIGDYLADTMHLTAEEHGAYLLLIMHYWKGGKIKNCPTVIQQIARIKPSRVSKEIVSTVSSFFEVRDGYLYHARIEGELQKALENQESQRKRTEAATAARQAKSANVTTNVTSTVTSNVTKTTPPSPSPIEERKGEHARGVPPSESDLEKPKKPKPEPAWPDSDPDNVDAYERCGNGFKLKENWCCPNEWFDWVRSEFGWDEARTLLESEKFRDYWCSSEAKKPIKTDWFMTWKNWCRTTNGVKNYGN